MKKVLLGTTALMAGGLVAGAATAADIVPAPIPEPIEEGFTVSINGDAITAFSFRDEDACEDFAAVDPDGVVNGLDISNAITAITGDPVIAANIAAHTGPLAGATATFGPCAYKDGHAPDPTGYHDDQVTHIYWDSDIDITAEITLANGLLVGFYLESDVDNGHWNPTDYWLGFEGHWGTIEIGQVDQAYKQLLVWVPGAGGIATVDSMHAGVNTAYYNNFLNGPADGAEAGLNINYFTPRIAGFKVGVSYSPDSEAGEEGSDGLFKGNHVMDSTDAYTHIWAVGIHWEHEFANGWGLQIGGGYTANTADTQRDSEEECLSNASSIDDSDTAEEIFGKITGDYDCGDIDTYGIGVEFSGDIITVGGGYTRTESQFGRDRWTAAIEGYAQLGDWEAGIGYAHEEDEHRFGGFEDQAEIVAVGVAKTIGPGVEVGGFFQWVQTDEAYHSALGVGDIDAFGGGAFAKVGF